MDRMEGIVRRMADNCLDNTRRDNKMVATSHPRTKKEVSLRGSVCEIEKGGASFLFQPIYGDKVPASAPQSILDKLPAASESDRYEKRILVKGIGVYRGGELEQITQVDEISLLHPLDVPARLDEFRDMKDGWSDGMQHPSDWGSGYGKAPSHEGLDWLAAKFTSEYPDDLPLPHTYPTPEGGIQMEWDKGNDAVIFEIDIDSRSAYWLWFDKDSDADDERHLNLSDMETWEWLASEIRGRLGAINE